jgi:hypothetical protein
MTGVVGRCLAGILLLAAATAGRLEAQGGRPLSATGSRGLSFGAVIPGVPTVVSRMDAASSGRFDVRGARNTEVRITLTLPAALSGPAGATLPLTFSANDGGYNTVNDQVTAGAFDPRTQLLARLSSQGRLFVFLGGTAQPAPTQRAGSYAATITLTAAYTGN